MLPRHPSRGLATRLAVAAGAVLLAAVVGLTVATPLGVLALHETERPEFCITCHLMDPYYASWQRSSHAGVACVECHYEPGALETLEGKIAAVNQVTKYVTRTEGTKPWADVSDLSCLRSGCHSIRSLEGEVSFGEVRFDHTPHLLEKRAGGPLRCTSCHAQVVQDEHISVSAEVCFTCHFHGGGTDANCRLCHGPPAEELDVAGRPFSHRAYLERGVACRDCHADVVRGAGGVRRERCRSCHGEADLLDGTDAPSLLHGAHVTERKVECFECHDEIRHGLLPPAPASAAEDGACGACHLAPHEASRLVYAGTGALGVADRPSRMFLARVGCAACHTGRSGPAAGGDPGHGAPGAGAVARAGNVDCLHCHGTGADGMLAGWQAVLGEELTRLEGLLGELQRALVEQGDPQAHKLGREARRNLELLRLDGSRGAHNPAFALDVLRAAGERIDVARARVSSTGVRAAGDPALPRAEGCAPCHLGFERTPLVLRGRTFSHEAHTGEAGLECDACHGGEDHGFTASARSRCAPCHHEEREDGAFDPEECGDCHGLQEAFLYGELEGREELLFGMEDKECIDCHGEPPDVAIPTPRLCVLCHDETYAAMAADWRAATDGLRRRVERALRAARREGRAVAPEALRRAREALRLVRADGSHGAHNHLLSEALLREALAGLGEAADK